MNYTAYATTDFQAQSLGCNPGEILIQEWTSDGDYTGRDVVIPAPVSTLAGWNEALTEAGWLPNQWILSGGQYITGVRRATVGVEA